jgi:hypothetical protein
MKHLFGSAYRNPARAPEHQPATRAQREESADPRPRPSAPRRSPQPQPVFGGVPLFPNTRKGLLERLAYYEARKAQTPAELPLDYHDVIHGRETHRRAPRAASGQQRRGR